MGDPSGSDSTSFALRELVILRHEVAVLSRVRIHLLELAHGAGVPVMRHHAVLVHVV